MYTYIYTYVYIYICIYMYVLYVYSIHHSRIFRSSYIAILKNFRIWTHDHWIFFRRSKRLSYPWVQIALRANFVQLLRFHLFVQCSHFISAIPFVSRHICFKQNLAQVITLAEEWLIHMVFTTEGFLEVALESWPEWD